MGEQQMLVVDLPMILMCVGRLSNWISAAKLRAYANSVTRHFDLCTGANAMAGDKMAQLGNQLLDLLPVKDRQRFGASCESVSLALGDVLCEPDMRTRYAYFPATSFVSLVASVDQKPGVEVGMVGAEGMLGSQLALGIPTAPLHALVQGSGEAWRIKATDLRRELELSTALRKILQRYIYVLMRQLASSAACQRFHQVNERLARWLLMTEDRAHVSQFEITHEFLSYMLGVRRVGVTTAAGALQRAGLIKYRRGVIEVVNRKGLEQSACSCYATDLAAYARLLIRKNSVA